MLEADPFSIPEVEELLPHLTVEEREELFELLAQDCVNAVWRPLPGPQSMAYHSTADVLGYGGAAGGGKTDLMIGKALNQHTVSYILRREATQMQGIYNRMTEIMGGTDGFNKSDKIWRLSNNRMVRFGSTPNLGDEMNYQGQARDFLGIDEAANFLRDMVVFLMGWTRTTDPNQPMQSLLTFNPPTTAEGRWVIDYFAPWLDEKYPNPALPGDLRIFASVPDRDGKAQDVEVQDKTPFVVENGEWVYNFDPAKYRGSRAAEIILPQSRTFVPSSVGDNPFLVRTNYMSTLQALPEPLRSQMLYGDFKAGMSDDPWQVIPTKWVEIAQARWKTRMPRPEIASLGVDVARGGEDDTVISRLSHDLWFDELIEYPGKETPDGPSTAGMVIASNRDHAPIHIDVIGVGASPYDFLMQAGQQVLGINVSEKALGTDKSGRLTFFNQRSELWWRMREVLDPDANNGVALPPGRNILLELTSAKWTLRGASIYVESREDIVKRIGRSPDRATAMMLALIRTPRSLPTGGEHGLQRGGTASSQRRGYNPYNR
jgi:hypothetical protein